MVMTGFASKRAMAKSKFYSANLCKEIMMTGHQIMALYPKTIDAILRLPTPKYKFSRANWYVAEFDEKNYWEVEQWCSEQFGLHPRQPDAWSRWKHIYENKIHFRDEKDYMWFMLKWGI